MLSHLPALYVQDAFSFYPPWRSCTQQQVNCRACKKQNRQYIRLLACEIKIWTVCPAGLVRGSPLTALMQWSGRSNVLFVILHRIPQVIVKHCISLRI